MSYLVLARKWRPQNFKQLVGQDRIGKTLLNAIAQHRVAHAFLFTGSRGVGKTSTARIFAKALNCSSPIENEPCNQCASCTEITEGRSLDVIEIDGASNRGINEIRELRDSVRYAPSRDKYKIIIIDEVHMLTTEAFNALLKTLEEPPSHAIFIFATTDPNKVPVTIVSRCQRYDFKRIALSDLEAHLSMIAREEDIAFEPGAINLIARHARGGLRDALGAMDQVIAFAPPPITAEKVAPVLGVASRETLLSMTLAILRHDTDACLALLAKVDAFGQNLIKFSADFLEFLRDVVVMKAVNKADALVELSVTEQAALSDSIRASTLETLERLFSLWYETTEKVLSSLSPKLLMEVSLIKMACVSPIVPIEPLIRRIDAMSRALASDAPLPKSAFDLLSDFTDKKKRLTETSVESTEVSAPHATDLAEHPAMPSSFPKQSESAEKIIHAEKKLDISPVAHTNVLSENEFELWRQFVESSPVNVKALLRKAVCHGFSEKAISFVLPKKQELSYTESCASAVENSLSAFFRKKVKTEYRFEENPKGRTLEAQDAILREKTYNEFKEFVDGDELFRYACERFAVDSRNVSLQPPHQKGKS